MTTIRTTTTTMMMNKDMQYLLNYYIVSSLQIEYLKNPGQQIVSLDIALFIITLGTWYRFLWPKLPSPGWIRCPPGPRTPRAIRGVLLEVWDVARCEKWSWFESYSLEISHKDSKKKSWAFGKRIFGFKYGVISGIYATSTAKGYISSWTWSPELSMIFWMKQYVVPRSQKV